MKWVIIKGVRYPSSVISAFAAYNMDNPFLKVRIRNKYHIVSFDDVNKMASQMVYLMNNYPDFVEIGRWWISKKTVMSWVPKGQAVDGSGWVISFTLSFGLEVGAPIDIAQSPMLMAAYEAGWDGAMRHLGGMSVDDAIMEILLERMIDIAFEDETV